MAVRRLLLTGSSGGIGSAVLKAAREEGFEVHEVNRPEWAALSRGEALFPGVSFDAVVYATGCCPVRPLTQLDEATWLETMEANCGLFVRLMRSLAKEGRFAARGAKVVAISSVSATEGWAGGSAYCASKGALSAVCRALDAELRARRVSVAAIEPRHVKTRMFDACAGRMGVPESQAEDPAALARRVVDLIGGQAE